MGLHVMRVLLLSVLLACGSTQVEPDAMPPPASGQLGLVRQVSWPGGGNELTVKLVEPGGGALLQDMTEAFELNFDGSGSEEFQVLVERETLAVGFTALLIKPATTEAERQEQVTSIKTFIEERPVTESIGLFLWLGEARQLASFTRDRTRLHYQIGRLAGIEPAADTLNTEAAIAFAQRQVLAIGGRAPRNMRAVVVVGGEESVSSPSAVSVLHGLEQASERIDLFASSSYYRVALCAAMGGVSGQLRVRGLTGVLPILLPAALPETAGDACDVASIGPGKRMYPEQIEFVFDSTQRGVYDDRVANLSKADFDLSVRFDESEVVVASAHLRGKGTLGCERNSYTLALNGPARHLLPASRTDEFYLISMCADDRYVQQFTANQLLAELGLFPLQFRYVELLIDNQTRGVYLLLEKPREELVRDNTGVHDVMRRRFNSNPPDDYFESKYSSGEYDAATIYDTAAADANLAEHIDLDQYLRFLALMTAYQNGDYIDEIWVVASEQGLAGGTPGLWFVMMAWDNDDLFSECHYSENHAFSDSYGLVYCAEATIDHFLLGDPILYAHYVDVLEDVLLRQVPPERFDTAVAATELAIMPVLARPGVSAAMVRLVNDNPGAVDPTEAARDVGASLDGLRNAYRARHALLLERIATYRGAQ